jgi:hypothetical protein
VDEVHAALAQLVEQLICNQQVVGSTPARGSDFYLAFHALYQGKRACCGHVSASHQFSFVGVIWGHFSLSRGPSVAQESFSLVNDQGRNARRRTRVPIGGPWERMVLLLVQPWAA